MQRLAGILFEMHAHDPDAPRSLLAAQFDAPVDGERLLVLRDLITLRQVRIEVILARENRPVPDGAAERQRGANREIDRGPVEHRQRAGQSETDRADVRVRRRAERSAASAENF